MSRRRSQRKPSRAERKQERAKAHGATPQRDPARLPAAAPPAISDKEHRSLLSRFVWDMRGDAGWDFVKYVWDSRTDVLRAAPFLVTLWGLRKLIIEMPTTIVWPLVGCIFCLLFYGWLSLRRKLRWARVAFGAAFVLTAVALFPAYWFVRGRMLPPILPNQQDKPQQASLLSPAPTPSPSSTPATQPSTTPTPKPPRPPTAVSSQPSTTPPPPTSSTLAVPSPSPIVPPPRKRTARVSLERIEVVEDGDRFGGQQWMFAVRQRGSRSETPLIEITPRQLNDDRSREDASERVVELKGAWPFQTLVDGMDEAPPTLEFLGEHQRGSDVLARGVLELREAFLHGESRKYVRVEVPGKRKQGQFIFTVLVQMLDRASAVP